LTTKDYLEVGKLCLRDSEPRNSESKFLSIALLLVKKQYPNLKLVFSWSDGMWGKPGYVYQASNFLYGGEIWTDVYRTSHGRRVHPLQLQSELKASGIECLLRAARPDIETQSRIGWQHFRGKQFRYIRFVCSDEEREKLLTESQYKWSTRYPKNIDCEWKIQTARGWMACAQPIFTSTTNWTKSAQTSPVEPAAVWMRHGKPSTVKQCRATQKNSLRCQNEAFKNGYCGQHKAQAAVEEGAA
jgi:hypothetical protein